MIPDCIIQDTSGDETTWAVGGATRVHPGNAGLDDRDHDPDVAVSVIGADSSVMT